MRVAQGQASRAGPVGQACAGAAVGEMTERPPGPGQPHTTRGYEQRSNAGVQYARPFVSRSTMRK
jgi:hypothetical protein